MANVVDIYIANIKNHLNFGCIFTQFNNTRGICFGDTDWNRLLSFEEIVDYWKIGTENMLKIIGLPGVARGVRKTTIQDVETLFIESIMYLERLTFCIHCMQLNNPDGCNRFLTSDEPVFVFAVYNDPSIDENITVAVIGSYNEWRESGGLSDSYSDREWAVINRLEQVIPMYELQESYYEFPDHTVEQVYSFLSTQPEFIRDEEFERRMLDGVDYDEDNETDEYED